MFDARKQLSEFKKFILRGNVVDLAVGVAIGAAFNAVVQALVADLITPLVAALSHGKTEFADRTLTYSGKTLFSYGHFLNTIITFLITATVIFFLVVQPINKLTAIANKGKRTDDPSTKKCPECLSEIPKDARRCKFCTAELSSTNETTPKKSGK
jgi:large conductance mechanosensitive channel